MDPRWIHSRLLFLVTVVAGLRARSLRCAVSNPRLLRRNAPTFCFSISTIWVGKIPVSWGLISMRRRTWTSWRAAGRCLHRPMPARPTAHPRGPVSCRVSMRRGIESSTWERDPAEMPAFDACCMYRVPERLTPGSSPGLRCYGIRVMRLACLANGTWGIRLVSRGSRRPSILASCLASKGIGVRRALTWPLSAPNGRWTVFGSTGSNPGALTWRILRFIRRCRRSVPCWPNTGPNQRENCTGMWRWPP